MPTLIVLRHAKSDYPPGVCDHDRPLSARGERNAATIADHLAPHIPPYASVGVAVSSALRAQETWAIVASSLSRPVQVWTDRQLYLAEPEDILDVSRCFTTDVGIVVGHNPGLAELVERAHSGQGVGFEHGRQPFRTSTFAVVNVIGSGWGQYRDMVCTSIVTCR